MKKYTWVFALMLHAGVSAQPAEQVSLVVAFPAGGPADRIARVLAERLGNELQQSIIVENKPGASGAIAASYVSRSRTPDNMMFLSNAGALTINPAVDAKLNYQPAEDFKAVSLVADTTTVVVTGAPTDIADAADLVRQMREGKRSYSAASSGVGGASHLSMEMFQEGAGVQLMHVPYKGATPAIADVVGKRVDLFIGDLPGVQGLIEGGKLKALGVAGEQPSVLLPGVRTLAEQGIEGVAPSGWYGVVMPANASDERVAAVSEAIAKVLKNPETVEQFRIMGAVATPTSPAEFDDFLHADAARWKALVERRNLTVEN